MSSLAAAVPAVPSIIYLGMDVHKDSITIIAATPERGHSALLGPCAQEVRLVWRKARTGMCNQVQAWWHDASANISAHPLKSLLRSRFPDGI
ncbi:hypothetical protein BH11GEM1_BH11GEM1_21240 [soil metagenome]